MLENKSIREQIIGHNQVLELLMRLIQNDRLPSLMIFAGPQSIGKKQVALAMAQELLCERKTASAHACGICGTCQRVLKKQSESLLLIEPDSAQIKIESAQQISHFLQLKSARNFRLVIMDQAHRMNPQTANALLKIFEEPPENTFFILVTSNPHALASTIRSRSQTIRFHMLEDSEIRKLTGAEAWMLSVARGQMDWIERLKEHAKEWQMRAQRAEGFIAGALKSNPESFAQIKEFSSDREHCQQSLFFWQNLVRDALCLSLDPKTTEREELFLSLKLHQIPDYKLLHALASLGLERLTTLSEQLLQMEADLQANVERQLIVENFYFSLSSMGKTA